MRRVSVSIGRIVRQEWYCKTEDPSTSMHRSSVYAIFSYSIIETSFPRWKLTNTPPKECHNCRACARSRCVTRDQTPWSCLIGFQRMGILTTIAPTMPTPIIRFYNYFLTRHPKPTNLILKQPIRYLKQRIVSKNTPFLNQNTNWHGMACSVAMWSWRQPW